MSDQYGLCDGCGEYHELSDVDGELLCEACQFPGHEPAEDDDED